MKTALDRHIESIRSAEELVELKQRVSVSLLEKPNRNFESVVWWHTSVRARNLGTAVI